MQIHADRQHIPESLKRHDHWVLWAVDGQGRKRPLAPWLRGDLYPVKWGSDAPERPETDWQTAWTYYRQREQFAAPSGITPEDALPAPLLLHDPLDPPLMQVDFDDVRDPTTGEVSAEVWDIIQRLDAFTEISQSGEGLHTFVRAELPGELGKFIADLNDVGQIELYDHGRCVGTTWEWIAETPQTVPDRQDVIDELVKEYEDDSQRRRRLQMSAPDRANAESSDVSQTPSTNRSDTSPYYDVSAASIAKQGPSFRTKHDRAASPGGPDRGPHPAHGNTSHRWDESSNFALDGDTWYCFAHDCGGGPIQLAAIMSGAVRCGEWGGTPNGVVTDDPETMLKAALWLREQGLVAADADPPYTALVGAAAHVGLSMDDPDEGILGPNTARLARQVYDELSLVDL